MGRSFAHGPRRADFDAMSTTSTSWCWLRRPAIAAPRIVLRWYLPGFEQGERALFSVCARRARVPSKKRRCVPFSVVRDARAQSKRRLRWARRELGLAVRVLEDLGADAGHPTLRVPVQLRHVLRHAEHAKRLRRLDSPLLVPQRHKRRVDQVAEHRPDERVQVVRHHVRREAEVLARHDAAPVSTKTMEVVFGESLKRDDPPEESNATRDHWVLHTTRFVRAQNSPESLSRHMTPRNAREDREEPAVEDVEVVDLVARAALDRKERAEFDRPETSLGDVAVELADVAQALGSSLGREHLVPD